MYLDIADDGVTLRLPEHTTDLYASYVERLSAVRISEILDEADAGSLSEDGAHVMVPVAALRRMAAGRVPEGWDADFDAMIAHAREKGWLSADGTAVQAHLERER